MSSLVYKLICCFPRVNKKERVLLKEKRHLLDDVSITGFHLQQASADLQNDKEVVLAAVRNDALALQYASDELKGDIEIVMTAVQKDGMALQHAAEEVKADRKVVLAALANNWKAVQHASCNKFADKEIVLQCVRKDGLFLQVVTDDLKADAEVAFAAVCQNDGALRYVPSSVWADKNFVLRIVAMDGNLVLYASNHLRNDKEVVLAAVCRDGRALKYASDHIKNDKYIVLAAARRDSRALQHASSDLWANREFVLAAMTEDKDAFQHASDRLKSDRDLVFTAVTSNGLLLRYAHVKLRADKHIVLAAVQNNPEALKYALGGLNQDTDCWVAAKLWDIGKKRDQLNNWSEVAIVPLSTKFSLSPNSESSVNGFTRLLNETPYFRDGDYVIYSPNAFSKSTCDPEWTRMEWPCRGTFATCKFMDPSVKSGPPTDDSCWRYSYRFHLEEAKRTNGFMLQVADFDDKETNKHVLGKGQEIEATMAKEVGCRVIRVCQPVELYGDDDDIRSTRPLNGASYKAAHFSSSHLAQLAAWLEEHRHDSNSGYESCEIQFWKYTSDTGSELSYCSDTGSELSYCSDDESLNPKYFVWEMFVGPLQEGTSVMERFSRQGDATSDFCESKTFQMTKPERQAYKQKMLGGLS